MANLGHLDIWGDRFHVKCPSDPQIILWTEDNLILSSNQSKEENTNNIQKAISLLLEQHKAMLDGNIYDVYHLEDFI